MGKSPIGCVTDDLRCLNVVDNFCSDGVDDFVRESWRSDPTPACGGGEASSESERSANSDIWLEDRDTRHGLSSAGSMCRTWTGLRVKLVVI
jgi:hypothetical protein